MIDDDTARKRRCRCVEGAAAIHAIPRRAQRRRGSERHRRRVAIAGQRVVVAALAREGECISPVELAIAVGAVAEVRGNEPVEELDPVPDEPEAVILPVEEYTAIMNLLREAAARDEAALNALRRKYDERLQWLNAPGAGDVLDGLFDKPLDLNGKIFTGTEF